MSLESSLKNVLIIDDDEPFRKLVAMILEAPALRVIEASGGREGLRILADGGVDLLITDLVMPDQDGIAVLREARRSLPDLKIIVVSGVAARATYLSAATRLGADATIDKADVWSQLAAKVKALLQPERPQ